MHSDGINYSQCWEDPDILREALAVDAASDVVSIASGGDNALALLMEGPASIVAVDLNRSQNMLLSLKRAAASLPYPEYLELLGVAESARRRELFLEVAHALPADVRAWWEVRQEVIRDGVIHAGKFERYTRRFARHIVPLIHRDKLRRELLSFADTQVQIRFFRERFNTPLWRLAFRAATGRHPLSALARDRAMFAYAPEADTAFLYEERLASLLSRMPARGNFFLEYSLTGAYGSALPPYLMPEGHARLQALVSKPLLSEETSLTGFLASAPDGAFSAYNLSDIFEALSPEESEALWEEIVRTARPGARAVFWTNLVERPIPDALGVREETELSRRLSAKDRVFFYGGVRVATIMK